MDLDLSGWIFEKLFGWMKYASVREKVTVVIPCFNEERTVGRVVRAVWKSPLVGEVVVVDDGSADASAAEARRAGARVVTHRKNRGKGAAVMSGAKAARHSVLVFLDADFRNVNKNVVNKLAWPLINGQAVVCKATFGRKAGRLTELMAKPLLDLMFPEVGLSQPLSGQFAIRKNLLLSIDVPSGWGMDIGIVLDTLKRGERIVEVDIGHLEHKHRPLGELAKTSREVMKTILRKAGLHADRHRLVIFDFDGVLVKGSSVKSLAHAFHFNEKLAILQKRYCAGDLNEKRLTRLIAKEMAGNTLESIREAAKLIRKREYAEETLLYLRRMGYRIAVVSFAFRQVITSCFDPSLIDDLICPVLEEKDGKITGKAIIPAYRSAQHVFCKGRAAKALMRAIGASSEEMIVVGDSPADIPMLNQAGVALTMTPSMLGRDIRRIKTLPELLVIAS
jgi:HAD superfamily phosphoserine phosphatase-like hydrolase